MSTYPAYGGHGPTNIRVGLAFLGVTTFLMALRLWTYFRVKSARKKGRMSLVWASTAYVVAVACQASSIMTDLHGLGNDTSIVVSTGQIRSFLLWVWVTITLFWPSLVLGKIAVCVFLLELQSGVKRGVQVVLYTIIAANIVVHIPAVVLSWTQCTPPLSLLDPVAMETQCPLRESFVYYAYFVGVIAAVSDFAIAIVPIWLIWPLQIERSAKFGLILLMSTGVFAGACAIIRTYCNRYVNQGTKDLWQLFLWGELEEWVLLISVNVPPVYPLFKPHVSRFADYVCGVSRGRSVARIPETASIASTGHGKPAHTVSDVEMQSISPVYDKKNPLSGQ